MPFTSHESVTPSRWYFFALMALVSAAFVLGGGAVGFTPAFALVLIVTAGALGVMVWHAPLSFVPAQTRMALIIGACFASLPLFQLIPLPPALFGDGGVRDVAASARVAVGQGGAWVPLSVSPVDTWLGFFGIGIVLIAFAAGSMMRDEQRRMLVKLLVAFAFMTIGIGAFQVAGAARVLDFHNSGHRGNVIGLFANRNHAALYLAAMMPFWAYLVMTSKRRLTFRTPLILAGLLILGVGIIGTTSRAGVILGALGFGVVAVGLLQGRKRAFSWRWIAACAGVIVLFSALVASTRRFADVIARFDLVGADLRWGIWSQSWDVAMLHLPWGTGLGTFRAVYDPLEPLTTLSPQFVNNAHNDYIEWLIEAGLPGVLMLALLVGCVVWRFVTRRSDYLGRWLSMHDVPAFTFLGLALLHSFVDYPVRRLAIAVPLAIVLGFLFRSDIAGRTTRDAKR